MADRDPVLESLLKAERSAFERYDRLRGYPGGVQEVALGLWTEAQEGSGPGISRKTSVGRFYPRLTGAQVARLCAAPATPWCWFTSI
jgi:hypothetical protein